MATGRNPFFRPRGERFVAALLANRIWDLAVNQRVMPALNDDSVPYGPRREFQTTYVDGKEILVYDLSNFQGHAVSWPAVVPCRSPFHISGSWRGLQSSPEVPRT